MRGEHQPWYRERMYRGKRQWQAACTVCGFFTPYTSSKIAAQRWFSQHHPRKSK